MAGEASGLLEANGESIELGTLGNLAESGKVLGRVSALGGIGLDVFALSNYYQNGPGTPNTTAPVSAVTDIGLTALAFTPGVGEAGLALAGTFFVLDKAGAFESGIRIPNLSGGPSLYILKNEPTNETK